MIWRLPVWARAARMAAMTASVPEPSMRSISMLGIRRLTSLASCSSYSWNRPVTGPQRSITLRTLSRTGAVLLGLAHKNSKSATESTEKRDFSVDSVACSLFTPSRKDTLFHLFLVGAQFRKGDLADGQRDLADLALGA